MGGKKPPTRMDLITSQVILENDHRILWLELVSVLFMSFSPKSMECHFSESFLGPEWLRFDILKKAKKQGVFL